jgi:hypothetical protein
MKTTALTIVVPPEIVALPDLSLVERIALSAIAERPACSNAALARLLGFSERGIESMLRRLRERRLIEQIGKGRARAHGRMFPVEHHAKCGKDGGVESQTKIGENEIVESHFPRGQNAIVQ